MADSAAAAAAEQAATAETSSEDTFAPGEMDFIREHIRGLAIRIPAVAEESGALTPRRAAPPQQQQAPDPAAAIKQLLGDPATKELVLKELGVAAPPPFDPVAERARITEELRAEAARETFNREVSEVRAQLRSPDPKIASAAAGKIAELLERQDSAARAETERQTLQRALAVDLFKNVFGVDPKDMPPEALRSYDKMQEFILAQSPAVRTFMQGQLSKVQKDQEAVGRAQTGATLSQLLQQARVPDSGSGSVSKGAQPSFDEMEQGWLAGRVSDEAYTEARKRRGLGGSIV